MIITLLRIATVPHNVHIHAQKSALIGAFIDFEDILQVRVPHSDVEEFLPFFKS